ncbi:MAG: type II secretion system protein, partial [Chlamydiia bacterium]|nr:type II secretion system protein [Chlamydiia bacterium]
LIFLLEFANLFKVGSILRRKISLKNAKKSELNLTHIHPLTAMKKRPFILIEVLIAISLLSLCALPLISEPLFAQKKMREKYFALELEREAEKIYYEILQKELSLGKITRKSSDQTSLGPIVLSIEGLGKKTYKDAHYHLYHKAPDKHRSPYYMIHLRVCFEKCKSKNKDPEKEEDYKYKFQFVGKLVDQKKSNLHVENHERLSSDVQAIRQSE